MRNPRATFLAQSTEKTLDRLPSIKLDHLVRMTDQTGIVEHAGFVVPNYPEGYTTDDNARALIVAILLEEYGAGAPTGAADLVVCPVYNFTELPSSFSPWAGWIPA